MTAPAAPQPAPVRLRLTNPVTGTRSVPVRTGQSAGGSRSL